MRRVIINHAAVEAQAIALTGKPFARLCKFWEGTGLCLIEVFGQEGEDLFPGVFADVWATALLIGEGLKTMAAF